MCLIVVTALGGNALHGDVRWWLLLFWKILEFFSFGPCNRRTRESRVFVKWLTRSCVACNRHWLSTPFRNHILDSIPKLCQRLAVVYLVRGLTDASEVSGLRRGFASLHWMQHLAEDLSRSIKVCLLFHLINLFYGRGKFMII